MRQAVTLYTDGRFWIGYVDLQSGERFSDLLNDSFVERSDKYHKFLQINDVTINSVDSKLERRLKIAYVNKESILIALPHDEESYTSVTNAEEPSNHPFIQKTPIFATIVMPGYEVGGYIHCSSEQTPWSMFEEQSGFIPLLKFIPVTNVRIKVLGSSASWSDPFAAVNREQVISFDIEASE